MLKDFLTQEKERFEKEIPTPYFFERGDTHKSTPINGSEIVKKWIATSHQRLIDMVSGEALVEAKRIRAWLSGKESPEELDEQFKTLFSLLTTPKEPHE